MHLRSAPLKLIVTTAVALVVATACTDSGTISHGKTPATLVGKRVPPSSPAHAPSRPQPPNRPPTPSPPPAPGSPAAHLVARTPGIVERLAAGDVGIYALVFVGSGSGVPHLDRFDALGRRLTSGPVVRRAFDVSVDGGTVWVSAGGTPGQQATRYLYGFDPSTLHERTRLTLPGPPGSLAASAAGLWVGSDHALFLVDPASGRVRKIVAVHGSIGRLAVDPAHDVLYASTRRVDSASVLAVEERDASTGTLIRRSVALKDALSMNALAATPAGVWAAFATGNMGSADLLRRTGLHVVAPTTEGEDTLANGIGVGVLGRILWLSDSSGGTLLCADPTTGRRRALLPQVAGDWSSNLVSVLGRTFIGAFKGLVEIRPGRRCRG